MKIPVEIYQDSTVTHVRCKTRMSSLHSSETKTETRKILSTDLWGVIHEKSVKIKDIPFKLLTYKYEYKCIYNLYNFYV